MQVYSYLTPGPSSKEKGVGTVRFSDFLPLNEKEREEKLVDYTLFGYENAV
jgi:hypothetical protein